MASPMVSAAAALIWAKNPLWTPDQVIAALVAGATDLGAPGKDNYYGHGRINVWQSLQYVPSGSMRISQLLSTEPYKQPVSSSFPSDYRTGELLLKLSAKKQAGEIVSDLNQKMPYEVSYEEIAGGRLIKLFVPGAKKKRSWKYFREIP